MTEVLAYNRWPSNADLIADVAELYLPSCAYVLDATWGLGTWWRKLQDRNGYFAGPRGSFTVAKNDKDIGKGAYHFDVRELPPFWHGQFDVVTYDPPYKLNGTPSSDESRYGLTYYVPVRERNTLLMEGIWGCAACVKPGGTLWVKCADQVAGGKVHWQTTLATNSASFAGLELVDRFDMVRTPRPQPEGRAQIHARRNGSTLLVFREPR